MQADLLIRNVTVRGHGAVDVAIDDGRITAICPRLSVAARVVLEGHGGALLPGLHDHHIHLLGAAAQLDSVVLTGVGSAAAVAARIRERAHRIRTAWVGPPVGVRGEDGPPVASAWVRATGYDEDMAGPLAKETLDQWLPDVPLRVQYHTGSLWVFNTRGLSEIAAVSGPDTPLERDAAGEPTGRLWDGDAWLKTCLPTQLPPLAALGRQLAAAGVTALTDASAGTGADEAALLARAHACGDLPQHLHLMSRGPLVAPADGAYAVGPVKIMLHEARLPDFDDIVLAVRQARAWNRRVAFHCATPTELSLALAVLDVAGTLDGDRIEHGSIIDDASAAVLAERSLTVVTQPAFIEERGDAYLARVDAGDIDNLYRCAGLLRSGVRVAGSSDAPYAEPDPWTAIRAASRRRTRSGHLLGGAEIVAPQTALNMFLGSPEDPGGTPRVVAVGADADLCMLKVPLHVALADPHRRWVAATVIAGRPAFVDARCATM
ncbi:amidohydrolase family protein [Comamonadaceae bacterium G21597-S1]|nr:amidohydrolase family protein [Comamonadaceae bacterium G21597-S1]